MKYLLSFFMFVVMALAVLAFLQYQQITKLQDEVVLLNNKIPKFGEAATELEQRIIKLEMEAAFQKGMGNIQQKQPQSFPSTTNSKMDKPVVTNPNPEPANINQNPATFKDMQKRQ